MANGVKQYLAARDAKPMPHLGDVVHSVNVGSEFEGTLLLSDLREFVATHDALLDALKAARKHVVIHRNDFGEVLNEEAEQTLAKIDAALSKAGA